MSVFLASPHAPVLRHLRSAMLLLGVSISFVTAASEDLVDDKSSEPPRKVGYREEVTVIVDRLADRPGPIDGVPAHVTVIDRERIEQSGARTLQDLLALEAGVVLYDQVGNDVQKTFDLRGMSGGTGTRVFLDGAPVNDPRSNALALHLIPLDALERVEITRGSAATLAGGGSEAGVIHLRTRRADSFGGSVSLAAGSDDASRLVGELGNRTGRWDYLVSANREDDDGFRQNARAEMRRVAGSLGVELGDGGRLDLSVFDTAAEFGNPGALTLEEYERDPGLAPFNSLDFSEERFGQAALNYRGPLTGSWSLAANLFAGDREAEILSTGRAAQEFGGFFLDSSATSVGSTLQATRRGWREDSTHALVVGVEWLDGAIDADGFFTSPEDPGTIDAESLGSRNRTERRTWGLYVQETWEPAPGWTLTAGARLDRDRVGYAETIPDPVNTGSRRFSELSFRGGATWRASERHAFHASYGEAFLAPATEQLFAFPLFGSNPDLAPEDSRSYELGFRGRWSGEFDLDTAVFRVETRDEIVFDPDSPLGLFGANINAGETRRDGVEISFRARPAGPLGLFANATLVDSEFRAGDAIGNRVPLVPRLRFSAGLNVSLPREFELRIQALHSGDQVLDNDDANQRQLLDAYTVVDARLGWQLPFVTAGDSGTPHGGVHLFVEARNLFDRDYATRGIYAWDFPGGQNAVFLTPAPGRRFMTGARLEF